MSIINSQPLIGASGNQSTAYNLTRSLRLRRSATGYLSKTYGVSPTSRTTMTYSAWVKRGSLGATMALFGTGNNYESAYFNSSDQLYVGGPYMSAQQGSLTTTQVFRDPSAWYHIVVVFDTTNATAGDRLKLYVNGTRVTSFSSSTNSNQNNTTTEWLVSGFLSTLGTTGASGSGNPFDGYKAEEIVVDGQALDASSFGETDTATGVWKPKKYTGTYGTNGFYLKFDNLTSTSTLGNDSSGNSNTWTVNNISLTSGSTYDSMKDVPTLTDADTANYCTLNPLQNGCTLSNANLTAVGNSGSTVGTMAVSSGKWYYEATVTTLGTAAYIGFADLTWQGTGSSWTYSQTWVYLSSGNKGGNGSSVSYGATYTTGDVIGIALDLDNGTLTFYKNNSTQGTAFNTGLSGVTLVPFVATASPSNTTYDVNFGQRPFAYTPPSGFVALNTFNLPTPTIGATATTQANDYFDVTLYTGNGTSRSIVNSGAMSPDLVWIKNRSQAYAHRLFDTNRGAEVRLFSNTTDAEGTSVGSLTAFNSDGFSLGADTAGPAGYGVNENGSSFVAWQWRASDSTAVSNTAGTITSTVSANTTAGFSIVTYTGNGTNNATIGHGLGVAPSMVIVKSRTSGSRSWFVAHTSLATNNNLLLQTTDSAYGPSAFGSGVIGGLTSTVFECIPGTTSPNNVANINTNGDNHVAYCFAEVAGYSKFGSYTGNGSTDGTFVFTGFRPKFVIIKASSSVSYGNWVMKDTTRNPSNIADANLYANLSNAEDNVSTVNIDILSNGFKLRGTYDGINGNGSTYIYAAFADTHFKYSLGR